MRLYVMKIIKSFAVLFLAFAMVMSSVLISSFKNTTNCNSKIFADTVNIDSGEGWSYDNIDGEKTLTLTGSVNNSDFTTFLSEVETVTFNGIGWFGVTTLGNLVDGASGGNTVRKIVIKSIVTVFGTAAIYGFGNTLEEIWVEHTGLLNIFNDSAFNNRSWNDLLWVVPDSEIEEYETEIASFSALNSVTCTVKGLSEFESQEVQTGVIADIVLPSILVVTLGTVLVMFVLSFKRKKRI